jgi:hypothetical protein
MRINGRVVDASMADNYDASGNLKMDLGYNERPAEDLKTDVSAPVTTYDQIVHAIAFALNPQWLYTLITDMMSGDVRALSQHSVDCSGGAINTFQYTDNGNGGFNYQYMCDTPGGLTNITDNTTPFTSTTGSTLDLASQPVKCPTNAVMSQFQMATDTANASDATQLQYKYKCLTAPETSPLTCRTATTTPSRMNNKSKFLAKSNITCNADEAVGGFQYMLSGDKTEYYYSYTCCKA